jgi:hypothetical protein
MDRVVWGPYYFYGKVGLLLIEYRKINADRHEPCQKLGSDPLIVWMSYLIFPKRNVADYEIKSEWAIEWCLFLLRAVIQALLHAWTQQGRNFEMADFAGIQVLFIRGQQGRNFDKAIQDDRDIMGLCLRDCQRHGGVSIIPFGRMFHAHLLWRHEVRTVISRRCRARPYPTFIDGENFEGWLKDR